MTTRTTYPSYKPSGIDWLGDIPSHWEERRGKSLYRKLQRPVEDGAGTVTAFRDGQVTLRSNRRTQGFTEALQEIGYQGVRQGDLVIHAMDAFAGAVGVSESDGKCSPVYSVCAPVTENETEPSYMARCLRQIAVNGYIQAQAKGIRERSTDFRFESFANNRFPLPPLEEQRAIADYLDRKDAEITRFIESRRRMISLLEEKKQAIINQAVTKGLDSSVPMKESGVEWLGEIPAHWEVRRFKQVAHVQYGMGQPPRYVESGVPFLRATNVYRGDIDATGLTYIDANEVSIKPGAWLSEGDIIVVRSGAYTADSAIVTREFEGSIAGFDMVARAHGINSWFLAKTLLASYVLYDQLYQLRMRAAQPHLNAEELGSALIYCPPDSEQQQIVDYIDRESLRIRSVSTRFEREIELMQEYRTRLISDVVTGKVRVS